VTKAWKAVLEKEEELTLEMSLSGDEACTSIEDTTTTCSKNGADRLDADMPADMDASNNLRDSEANAKLLMLVQTIFLTAQKVLKIMLTWTAM